MGNGDDEADVEASDTEHEPGESDAVARRDGESDGGDAEMVLMSVSGADQAPVDETVPMSVGDLEQAPVTQVTQVTQVDAGDAGDTEGSDAPVARSNKRGGKKNMSAVRRRRQAMAKAARESDTDGRRRFAGVWEAAKGHLSSEQNSERPGFSLEGGQL